MAEKLNVFENIPFDDSIDKEGLHTYQPYGSNTYGYSDEINIVIQSQDLITNISESFLYIEGIIKCADVTAQTKKEFDLINNFGCFLFEEMRYVLGNLKCDVCRLPGITSTIKGFASYTKSQSDSLISAGWQPSTSAAIPLQVVKDITSAGNGNVKEKMFCVTIPLKHVFGFAEDYHKAIVNMRQELVLIRSRNDADCYVGDSENVSITLNKIHWKVPHITPSDGAKLELFEKINQNSTIAIPFRQWELYELPALKQTTSDIWSIKTSTQLEKPRFMLLAFQHNKRNLHTANASEFTNANITNIKLHLNSEVFPYENWNLNFNEKKYALAYQCYSNFQKNYYEKMAKPLFDYTAFNDHPIFIIDCSKQKETLKTSTVDIKVEMEARASFNANIMVYCLILHDTIVEYNPLTGEVRKL